MVSSPHVHIYILRVLKNHCLTTCCARYKKLNNQENLVTQKKILSRNSEKRCRKSFGSSLQFFDLFLDDVRLLKTSSLISSNKWSVKMLSLSVYVFEYSPFSLVWNNLSSFYLVIASH